MSTQRLTLLMTVLAACFADETYEDPGIVSASPTEAESSGGPSSEPPADASDGSTTTSNGTTTAIPATTDASTSSTSLSGASEDTGSSDDTSGSTGTIASSDCCGPLEESGCADEAIESCVCDADPYCCATQWDLACAVQAEDLGCGECGDDDEVASCVGLCTTFVDCAPELGHDDVDTCVELECLGLLDEAQADGDACLQAMTLYNACIGLLDCPGFDAYVAHMSPFPCEAFESDMFEACPFISD